MLSLANTYMILESCYQPIRLVGPSIQIDNTLLNDCLSFDFDRMISQLMINFSDV